jgi:hypothetical protein
MPLIRELLEEAVQKPATLLDSRGQADLIADVGGHRFVIEVKCSSRSASVASAISQLERNRARASLQGAEPLLLVVVGHMGSAGADLCRRHGVNWLDLDGNADIQAPDLRIRILGRRSRRPLEPQQGVNPFAAKASRVVHVLLLDPRKPWTRGELQAATGLDKGSVSRILGALQTGGYVHADSSAPSIVALAEPRTLLDAWAEHYRPRPPVAYGLLATRDGKQTEGRVHEILQAHDVNVIFSGLPAAAAYSSFGSFRRVLGYVDAGLDRAARDALMVSADHRGRNVVLVEDDGGAQIGAEVKRGRRYASPILAYLDLQREAERSDEAREELRRVIEAQWA